jgi:hypothetical protein
MANAPLSPTAAFTIQKNDIPNLEKRRADAALKSTSRKAAPNRNARALSRFMGPCIGHLLGWSSSLS